jgi:hypothetical protein
VAKIGKKGLSNLVNGRVFYLEEDSLNSVMLYQNDQRK